MLRQLDGAGDDAMTALSDALLSMTNDLTHSPNCQHPGTTTTRGHSVDVTRCIECGAVTTTRRVWTDTTMTSDTTQRRHDETTD
jgi:hypothetical protein